MINKQETYILRFSIDRKVVETASLHVWNEAKNLINSYDKNMQGQGYRRTLYSKMRIDKKHITNISVDYTRV